MPSKGRAEFDRYFAEAPEKIVRLLIGAGRAGANVVADEARKRSISEEVAQAIKVTVKRDGDRIIAKVQVKGNGSYIAPWLEYGTTPHFISVDESQRGGKSIGRINRIDNEARRAGQIGDHESLVINGNFVGATVFHPGAQRHPFLRPALDLKERDAIAAAQTYINTGVARLKAAGFFDDGGADE